MTALSANSRLRSTFRRLSLLLPCIAAIVPSTALAAPSAAREWNEELLAAIRRNVPNPPGHARNLFHVAVAMYDAWVAYDPTAVGYIYNEKGPPPAWEWEIEDVRREAISYAAYRVLRNRFATGAGAATSLASFDARLTAMGFSTTIGQSATTTNLTAADLGKRIGQAIITWGASDGFPNPPAYSNYNSFYPLNVMGMNAFFQDNMPLGFGIPPETNSGNHMFPGGFHHHTIPANTMQIDRGPSAAVDLQWCSFYDAADQAGISRRWGGIHPFEDDYVGRETGSVAGKSAYALAEKYWTGTIANEFIQPVMTMLPGGSVKVTWNATRGMYHKVQTSTNLSTWTDVGPYTMAYDTNGSWTDTSPAPGRKFYSVRRSLAP